MGACLLLVERVALLNKNCRLNSLIYFLRNAAVSRKVFSHNSDSSWLREDNIYFFMSSYAYLFSKSFIDFLFCFLSFLPMALKILYSLPQRQTNKKRQCDNPVMLQWMAQELLLVQRMWKRYIEINIM